MARWACGLSCALRAIQQRPRRGCALDHVDDGLHTPGARWVQVGAFGVSSNAKRAIGTLQGLGYTAATSRTRSGLTLVLAGPFASTAELKRALQILRGIYPDAYTRS